jgi:TolB-like protein
MKKGLLVIFMFLSLGAVFALPKVAVLNPTMAKGIEAEVASPVVDKILEELLRSKKFSILDRASRDVIWQERNFQITSGEIKSSEIKEVGKGLGADFVVTVKINRVGSLLTMSTTMINVETLEVIAQVSSEAKDSEENLLKLATYCGQNIALDFDGKALPAGSSLADNTNFSTDTTGTDAGTATTSAQADALQLKTDVRTMLRNKMFMNANGQKLIAAKAGALALNDKNDLYKDFKKDTTSAALGFVLNLTPVIKVGSFVQGDVTAGLLLGGAEAVCWIFIIDGIAAYYPEELAVGLIGNAIFYIWSWIQPGVYNSTWNKNLKKSLGSTLTYIEPNVAIRLAKAGAVTMPGFAVTLGGLRY